MRFTDDQIKTARTFVDMAKTRPIAVDRQVQFAVSRMQAHTKSPVEDVQLLIEALFTEPETAPVAAPPPPSSLRDDGPTLDEYVAAGYLAENYPPTGYAAK